MAPSLGTGAFSQHTSVRGAGGRRGLALDHLQTFTAADVPIATLIPRPKAIFSERFVENLLALIPAGHREALRHPGSHPQVCDGYVYPDLPAVCTAVIASL